MALLLPACVSVRIEQAQTTEPQTGAIDTDDAAVVLARRENTQAEDGTEFADCVRSKLADNGVKVYPERTFKDVLFPWFEPRVAPRSMDDLHELLQDAVTANRLHQTDVWYIVWVEGTAETLDPNFIWPVGFSWEDTLNYEISVWDLRAGSALGEIRVDANGRSYVLMAYVPLPLIARTKAAACSRTAKQLHKLLQSVATVPAEDEVIPESGHADPLGPLL